MVVWKSEMETGA